MAGVHPQSELTAEQAQKLLEAFKDSPGLQRLQEHFTKAPPPWPKVRDVSPRTP